VLALLVSLFLSPALPADVTAPVTRYADVTLRWQNQSVSVVKVVRGSFPRPTALRRWRGRFEARALAGAKTIDFVRFDFPLLADAEVPDEMSEDATKFGKKLREGVTATTVVRLPLPEGATAASVYDTRSKRAIAVELTPAATAAPAATGSPPAAGAAGSTKR
jgi:hypothetical protein